MTDVSLDTSVGEIWMTFALLNGPGYRLFNEAGRAAHREALVQEMKLYVMRLAADLQEGQLQ